MLTKMITKAMEHNSSTDFWNLSQRLSWYDIVLGTNYQ